MKVDDRKGLIDPALGVAHGVPHGPGAPAPPGGDGDQVTVSGAARELARLRAEVGDVGAVDQEKLRGLHCEPRTMSPSPTLRGSLVTSCWTSPISMSTRRRIMASSRPPIATAVSGWTTWGPM